MLTVILTGGLSRRMGRDKALLPFGEGAMSEYLIKKYSALGPVAVCVDRPGRFPTFGAKELHDPFPGMGPINGIVAAFTQTDAEKIFLTATDLPFGEPELALRLEAALGGHDVCAVSMDGMAEPMMAVYAKSALPLARERLASGRRAFLKLLAELDTLCLTAAELPEFDLTRVFQNLNTPEEYAEAHKIM